MGSDSHDLGRQLLATARRVAATYRPSERCEAESAAALALWQATLASGPPEPGLAWRIAARAAGKAVQRNATHGLTGVRDPDSHRPSWIVLPVFTTDTDIDRLSA